MLRQGNFSAESLVTQLAGERPFAVVGATRMNFETVRRWKHFLAFDTRIDVGSEKMVVVVIVRSRGAAGQQLLPQSVKLFRARAAC